MRPDLETAGAAGVIDGLSLPILSYRLRKDVRVRATPTLTIAGTDGVFGKVKITELLVHFCFNRLAIIEYAVEGRCRLHDRLCKDRSADDDPRVWRGWLTLRQQKPAYGDDHAVTDFGGLLNVLKFARQTYAPFRGKGADTVTTLTWAGEPSHMRFGGKNADMPATEDSDRPVGWLRHLLEQVLKPFGLSHWRILEDERARVIAGTALAGRSPLLPYGERQRDVMLARLADVEGRGTGFPYDEAFNRDALKDLAYRRFETLDWSPGDSTLYAVDDHSFVCLTYGWFGSETVLPQHLSGPYRRIVLIGQAYAGIFHKFSADIAWLSQQRLQLETQREGFRNRDDAEARDALAGIGNTLDTLSDLVRTQRIRFLGFANALWFEDVSPQMQAKDLYRMLRGRLGLKALYDEIQAELERTDTIEQSGRAERHETLVDKVSTLAAIAAGTIAMLDIFEKVLFAGDPPILPGSWLHYLLSLPISLGIGFLAAVLVHQVLRRDPFTQSTKTVLRLIKDMLRLKACGWCGVGIGLLAFALWIALANL